MGYVKPGSSAPKVHERYGYLVTAAGAKGVCIGMSSGQDS